MESERKNMGQQNLAASYENERSYGIRTKKYGAAKSRCHLQEA